MEFVPSKSLVLRGKWGEGVGFTGHRTWSYLVVGVQRFAQFPIQALDLLQLRRAPPPLRNRRSCNRSHINATHACTNKHFVRK